jgi:hypothetical protein
MHLVCRLAIFHLSRRGLASFERRFLKEFEKSLIVLVKNAFFSFGLVPQTHGSTCMDVTLQLHIPMPNVEMLADFLVLLPPIYFLTSLGTT